MRLVASLGIALVGVVALATPVKAVELDERLAKIRALEAQEAGLIRDRLVHEQRYREKTALITKLKTKRPSWNRDRELEGELRESQMLAKELQTRGERITRIALQLASERALLLGVIGEVLRTKPAEDVRGKLLTIRSEVLRKLPERSITIVEEVIDPLDDPEDLAYKAAQLAKSEAMLREEEKRLYKRKEAYLRVARLEKNRRRADEMDVFREEVNRRRTGFSTFTESPAENDSVGGGDDAASEDVDSDLVSTPGDPESVIDVSAVDLSIVYANVVEPGTLEEMRRSDRIGDPESRAKAAEHALADVHARAEKLKKLRIAMEERAKMLRKE